MTFGISHPIVPVQHIDLTGNLLIRNVLIVGLVDYVHHHWDRRHISARHHPVAQHELTCVSFDRAPR